MAQKHFNRLSRVHERYRQTTDRQTDGGRHIANINMSSRSLKIKNFNSFKTKLSIYLIDNRPITSSNHVHYKSYLCYCCKYDFVSVSQSIFLLFCVMCVCFFFFFFFHKVASLLGLCLFWQPATWFIYVQLYYIILLFMLWRIKFSLSLVRCP